MEDARRTEIEASWLIERIELPASDCEEFVSCDPDKYDNLHMACNYLRDNVISKMNLKRLRNNPEMVAIHEIFRPFLSKDIHDFDQDDFDNMQIIDDKVDELVYGKKTVH